jgi:uncharacterized protein (TIGR02147 family)
MSERRDWSEYLQYDFKARVRKNPSFSLRSYAKILDISPTHLSMILSNKRAVSPASALKIAERLGITPSETLQRLHAKRRSFQKQKELTRLLAEEEFKLISEWYYFAILGLADIKNNVADAQWIAKKISLPVSIADAAFQRLQRQGYITVNGGQFRNTHFVETQPDVSREEVRRYHKQVLNLAAERIDEIEVELREYISMTLAMNKRGIPAAKNLIRKFKTEFEAEFESGTKTDVFQFNIQFFPLAKPDELTSKKAVK